MVRQRLLVIALLIVLSYLALRRCSTREAMQEAPAGESIMHMADDNTEVTCDEVHKWLDESATEFRARIAELEKALAGLPQKQRVPLVLYLIRMRRVARLLEETLSGIDNSSAP